MKKLFCALMLVLLGWSMTAEPVLARPAGLWPNNAKATAVGGAPAVWRAGATNTDASNYIPSSGAQWSYVNRSVHTIHHAFNQIRLVIPLWYFSSSGTITENALPEAYDFVGNLEYPFTKANTGIPTNTRYRFTFNGANVFHYTVGGQTLGWAVSDPLILPFVVPADAPIGIWLTQECVAGRSGTVSSKGLFKAWNGSGQMARGEGQVNAATSYIDSDGGMTLTAITAYTTAQSGGLVPMGPAMLLTPFAPLEPSILANDNSIGAGVNEGNGVSGTAGDASGDQYGNRGASMRLAQALGINATNFSKGSDRDSYRLTANNYVYRAQGEQIANPTVVLDMNPTNEIALGLLTAGPWQASTAYALDTVVNNAGHYFIVDVAGTSGSTGPSGTGSGITDGTVSWSYIGDNDMTGAPQGAYWVGQRRKRDRMDRAAIPNATFVGITTIPQVAATPVTAFSYDSSSGNLSLTIGSVADLAVGSKVKVTNLSPSSFNTNAVSSEAVTAVDTTNNIVTLQRATGLTAPTGVTNGASNAVTLSKGGIDVSSQTPVAGFGVGAARSWINRFLRSSLAQSVLNYPVIFDEAKYFEAGAPTTYAAETGAFRITLDASNNPVAFGTSYDLGHGISTSYQYAASQAAANDNGLVSVLKAAGK